MEAKELIRRALDIAIDKKGERLRVLDVSAGFAITDYFVLITAQNRRQAQAICSAIDVQMKHAGIPKARIEGYQGGWWVLLDFDDVVIHIFQEEARDYYDLERLWADAKDLTEHFLEATSEASEGSADQRRDSR